MITQHRLADLPRSNKERIDDFLHTIKPGYGVIALEMSEELDIRMPLLTHFIPKAWRRLGRVPQFSRPVVIISRPTPCPSNSKSRAKPKRR